MKTLIYILLIIGLIVFGFTTPKLSGLRCDYAKAQSPQSPEILIIDLSKRLPENPYQEEYEKMLWPTVRIKTTNSTGSGVVFDHSKLHISNSKCGMCNLQSEIFILTAAHVVGDESTVTVEIFTTENTKDTEIPAIVVMTDTVKDLALLRFNPSNPLNPRLYTARLAPEDYQPYIFTPVYSVGCSLGLTPRPSDGIISVIEDTYWEVSSPILPGNSGGPVFAIVPSDDGNASTYAVIGIAVWIHTYNGQLITTMAGIVPVQSIHEFINHRSLQDKFTQMNTE